MNDRQRQSGALVHLSETICTSPPPNKTNHPSIQPSIHCHFPFPFSVPFYGSQVAGPFGTRATLDSAQLGSICAVFGIFYSLFNEPVYWHFVGYLAPRVSRVSKLNCFVTFVWSCRLQGSSTGYVDLPLNNSQLNK